jgi:hypothetical protein
MDSTCLTVKSLTIDLVPVIKTLLLYPITESSIAQLEQLMIKVEEKKDFLLLADITNEEEAQLKEEIDSLLFPLHQVIFIAKLVSVEKKIEKKFKLETAVEQLKAAIKSF